MKRRRSNKRAVKIIQPEHPAARDEGPRLIPFARQRSQRAAHREAPTLYELGGRSP